MIPSPTAPHRPALRYHGAKWRLAPWIISCIPAAHDSYIEPFGGSAAVLLRKSRSPIEVYNDLDGDVVAFFRMLRERPDDLIRAIYWTPFAHAEQQLSRQPTDDPLERARRLYARSYLTISGQMCIRDRSYSAFAVTDPGEVTLTAAPRAAPKEYAVIRFSSCE